MPAIDITVLASGSGTLLQSLIDNQDQNYRVKALITDRQCAAIARAQDARIPVQVIPLGSDRAEWDRQVLRAIEDSRPDVVVSAGFGRILGSMVLSRYQGRIINTHPALLPQFPGAHAVRDALAAGAKTTGCTVHYVDAGVDTGLVIDQRPVLVMSDDDESSLHERIRVVERALIVDVVRRIASGELTYPQEV